MDDRSPEALAKIEALELALRRARSETLVASRREEQAEARSAELELEATLRSTGLEKLLPTGDARAVDRLALGTVSDYFVARLLAQPDPGRAGIVMGIRRAAALRSARRAMRARQWAEAELSYRQLHRLGGMEPRFWVQYGHALKEQGHLAAAAGAYRTAALAAPGLTDAEQALDAVLGSLRAM